MVKTYRQAQTFEDRLIAAEDVALGSGGALVVEAGTTVLIRKAHIGKVVSCTNGSAVALTVPQDSDAADIQIGDRAVIRMDGAGQVTITAGSGATLRKAAATAKILARYGEVTIRKIAANTWSTNGELAAS